MTTASPATGPSPNQTESTFPDDPALEVWRQARTYVEDVFKTETRWAATQKRFTAFTALEYRDRFLIELIQNASDAHDPKGSPGLIWIRLDRDEEPFGCLYVANTGRPFTLSNFRSLAELGMSDKEPGSAIGHKGVGFRSVLSVSDRPEIYSARPDVIAGDAFTGFCFGFASEHDIRALTAEHPERFERVVSEVSPYCLPVPISKQPAQVQKFSSAGVATEACALVAEGLARRGCSRERGQPSRSINGGQRSSVVDSRSYRGTTNRNACGGIIEVGISTSGESISSGRTVHCSAAGLCQGRGSDVSDRHLLHTGIGNPGAANSEHS